MSNVSCDTTRRFAAFRRSALVTLALSALATACRDSDLPSAPAPLDAARRNASPASSKIIPGEYIVAFADDESDVPGLATALVAQSRGTLRHTYTSALKGFAATLSDDAAAALAHNPRVRYVESDVVIMGDTIAQAGATWGIDRIDQRALPLNGRYAYQESGAGVTAYIVDSGIRYSHSEFGGRASFGFDAFGGDGSDCSGHGTHVSGTVGGATYGVAKGVSLVSVKVLDCNGSGTSSGVIAGLDWIASHAARPAVANMSLGGGVSQAVDDAVERLYVAGIATAVSAGNSNVDACTQSPARAPHAMTVGASDNVDARAYFSNYGTCVDWFAPGMSITSSAISGDLATAVMSGTSMASPHTTGAAALFLQKNPAATAQQVRDGLYAQSTKGVVTSASSANNHLLYSFADSAAVIVAPNTAPTASFTFQCPDLGCSFTDGSTDAEGAIASWSWSFGDGTTSTLKSPSHTYAATGTYSVTLTVTDAGGLTSASTRSVTASVIKLSARAYKVKASTAVELTWSGVSTATVDVFKNSTRLATVANSGKYNESNAGKGSVSANTYRVCEAGTSNCSAAVSP